MTGAGPPLQRATSDEGVQTQVSYDVGPSNTMRRGMLRFTDEDERQVMLEMVSSGALHCYVNGRHKVSKVTSIHVEGRTLHIDGKRLLAASCVATVPEGGTDGMEAEDIILGAMELFNSRALPPEVPQGSRRLTVWIVSARGLRDADGYPGQGASDPYCVCEIAGRPGRKVTTKVVKNQLSPAWNHIAEIGPWAPGERLLFQIWDKDWCSRDDFLGRVELAVPKGEFPSFEGELPLRDCGMGVEAFLTVRVYSGTRDDRRRRRLKSELRRASLPETLDSDRLRAMLEEAKAMGLSAEDRAESETLLEAIRALHDACQRREAEPLRRALQAGAGLGLGEHSVSAAGREVLAEVEARDRLRKVCLERPGVAELGEAVQAANEACLADQDYGDSCEILSKLTALAEACVADDPERLAAALKAGDGLQEWPEHAKARERGTVLADALLAEECGTPSVDGLRKAIRIGKELHASPQTLTAAKTLLEALLHVSAAAERTLDPAEKDPPLAPLLTALEVARGLGANEANCKEYCSALERLRELAIKNLGQAHSRTALRAALEVAREARLGKAQLAEAEDIFELMEGLERACVRCSEADLRGAITAADLVDFDKGRCAEYARAKQQLAAYELLREARQPGADPGVLTAAIHAAKEAGLSPVDYESAGEALNRAKLEETIREKLARAEQRRCLDDLERALDAARLVGLEDLEECHSARRVLHRLQAAEELRQACEEPVSVPRLRKAWEACRSAGLEDRGRHLPDEARSSIERARRILAEEDRKDTARCKLDAAMSSGVPDQLRAAIDAARAVGLPGDELARGEARFREEEQRKAAKANLEHAIQSASRSALSPALDAASGAGLSEEDMARAQALLGALERLRAVAGRGDAAELREAVAEFGDDRIVARSAEFASCRDRLKAEEAKEKERAKKEKAEREQREKREKEQASARNAIAEALKEGSVAELRAALDAAKAARLPSAELGQLEAALGEAVAEEARRLARAREELREALDAGATVQQLEGAVLGAGRVRLPSSDTLFVKAREALAQKREALRMLNSAINEKELKTALEVAKQAGMADSPEYRDAKAQLERAKELQKRTEHLQQTRADLEEAIRLGKKEPLERALRQARLLNMDHSERVFRMAIAKLKDAMEEHISRLVRKVTLALKEGTLDKRRLDDMDEAKEELVSALKIAKDVGVVSADLQDLEKLRKRIHNIVEDLKGSIRVFCRVRPLSSKEVGQGDQNAVRQPDPMTVEVLENKQSLDGRRRTETHPFHFDAVFTPGKQDAVFADCKELVQSALDGYNVTIFAYGQTGAGKTHTMTGEPGNEGIAPSTVDEIFSVMELNKSRMRYEVSCSITELYCNNFIDLLRKSAGKPQELGVEIKWDKDKNEVAVEGLSEEVCTNAKELRALLVRGQESRKVAQTHMNHASSRSHLIVMIKIVAVSKTTGERLKGKLVLVDLAGSERIKKSKPSPQQQQEAIEINKSLTALVDVVEALVHNGKEKREAKQRIIPYRNHKLTMLLQDTLGGSAKALMFVNCSPADSNIAETLSSLRYAARAKTITNVRSPGAARTDDTEAAIRARPLMARLRTTRSNEDLSRYKTFHQDDDFGGSPGRGRSSSTTSASSA